MSPSRAQYFCDPEPVPFSDLDVLPYYSTEELVAEPSEKRVEPEATISGLKFRGFVYFILILVTLLAAGIGVGLGGGLENMESNTSEADIIFKIKMTRESTNTDGLLSATDGCPVSNATLYTPKLNSNMTFQRACRRDFKGGEAGEISGNALDIRWVLAYSLEDCVDQCVFEARSGNCSAVLYEANITAVFQRSVTRSGNCCLKDQRSMGYESVDENRLVESAWLMR